MPRVVEFLNFRIAFPRRDEKRKVAAIRIAPPTRSYYRKKSKDRRRLTRRTSASTSASRGGPWRHGQQTFALETLARQLAGAAHGFGLFTGALFGGLLVVSAHLHFTEDAFALHFLLERAESLVNIVIANEYLHGRSCLSSSSNRRWLTAAGLRSTEYRELRRHLAESAQNVESENGPCAGTIPFLIDIGLRLVYPASSAASAQSLDFGSSP